jgi:dimeric dUTPase (all-alpha-NTP-PPase superfamily)
LQAKLNVHTCGEHWWKTEKTSVGTPIRWNRCIHMEMAEFIDSFSWKHWKDLGKAPNLNNAKVELVDTWHFIMSQVIVEHRGKDLDTASRVLMGQYLNSISDRVLLKSNYDEMILYVEKEIISRAASSSGSIYSISGPFFNICFPMELKLEDIYTLYIGKNTLNVFRQNNGYKTGEYQKIWAGWEDNEVMTDIVAALPVPEVCFDTVYSLLEKAYKLKDSKEEKNIAQDIAKLVDADTSTSAKPVAH